MAKIGLYVHIPFCASKCGYCDFYSITDRAGQEAYLNVLLEEIRSYQGRGLRADTLFVGGGTPSILESGQLAHILAACRDTFSLSADAECTLEANPDSVSPAFLAEVRAAGYNRISFGAQSGIDTELTALGRRHDAAQIGTAAAWARGAGFENLSLDIMLGIPGQTAQTLAETLAFFVALAPEHISCYLLKIEENTPFFRQHMERFCAGEDASADLYLAAVAALAQAGYAQYEISNFARPGFASAHNLKYWRCENYLGFGPAAHSFLDGKRFYHPRGLTDYLESDGANCVPDGAGGDLEEQILLGLRLTAGIDCAALQMEPAFREKFLRRATELDRAGLALVQGSRVCLTPRGFLVSNSILSALLPE